jgi:hypothetical protein
MPMTGRELCGLLGVNYDEIIHERKGEQPRNLDYFMEELMKIPEAREKIGKMRK